MPVSTDQRQTILSLLAQGLDNVEIARQTGVTPGTVAAIKAHMSMGSYEGGGAPASEVEATDIGDAAFGLERDLQLALRHSLEQLEPGLAIIDGDHEQSTPSGRIDITARDERGDVVVIELKAGTADRDAIAQILSYMGDLMERATAVRGILVAREFSARAVAAAKAAPNIRLVRYGFRFTFETVGR